MLLLITAQYFWHLNITERLRLYFYQCMIVLHVTTEHSNEVITPGTENFQEITIHQMFYKQSS